MQIRLIRLIRRWEKEGVQHEESCSCCSTLIMLFDKGRGADAGSGGYVSIKQSISFLLSKEKDSKASSFANISIMTSLNKF